MGLNMLRRLPSILAACGHCTRISSGVIKPHLQRHSFHKSSNILYSFSDKDLPSSDQPIPVKKLYDSDTDILYNQLNNSKSIVQLLELASQHLDVMNNKHIVTSFNVIYATINREKIDFRGRSETVAGLQENEIFQALCNHTLDRIRYMDRNEVITVFKTLTALGIKTNTYIMQAVLKMICSQVNELTLSELSFLSYLLYRHKSGAAVDGLKMALPLVLQVQIENQLDSDNVNEVVGCLKVCSQARLKASTFQKIVSALLKKTDVLTAEQAVAVIFSLLNIHIPLDGYLELLNSAFHIAANNIEQLKVDQILHVVRLCSKFNFFHGGFLVASATKAVADQWNLHDCMELQKYLHWLSIFHEELLDLLSENIISNADTVMSENRFSPFHIATSFAVTDYHPPGIEKVLEILCSSEEKLSSMYESLPHFYTGFASCLSVLGYFPELIFQHALNESFLMKALSIGRRKGQSAELEKNICTLMWSIEAHGKSSCFQVPTAIKKQVVQSVINKHMKSREYPLTKFLEHGLGGSQFFCTGIFSRSGHIIDHVIAMRSGNYPVSLSSINDGLSALKPPQQITYIEGLRVPDDAKIIAVLLTSENSYCKEPSVLKSWEKMKFVSLSKMNYFPVMINYSNWQNLPDREKIPYLMREIKQAVDAEDLSRKNLP